MQNQNELGRPGDISTQRPVQSSRGRRKSHQAAASPKNTYRVKKADRDAGKKKKKIQVAKKMDIAATQGSLKIAVPTNKGVEYDEHGEIVSYSILGKTKNFPAADREAQLLEQETQEALEHGAGNRHPSMATMTGGSGRPLSRIERRLLAAEAARQKELERDEKRLSKMTIAEKIQARRQESAMKTFEKYQQRWGNWKEKMGKKLGKDPSRLVVAQSEAYRAKKEEYELVQAAVPTFLKFGGDAYWAMSLRGSGERLVQVGNVFSGLSLPEKFHDAVSPEIVLVPGRAAPPKKEPANHKATFLETRKKQFGKRIRQLMPYRPGQEVADSLCIAGQDLFQWARETSNFGTNQDAEESAVDPVVDEIVADADGDGRPDNPDAADFFDEDGDGDYDGPLAQGPSFEVGVVDDAGAITQRSKVGVTADGAAKPLRVLLKAVKGKVCGYSMSSCVAHTRPCYH